MAAGAVKFTGADGAKRDTRKDTIFTGDDGAKLLKEEIERAVATKALIFTEENQTYTP